jgi:hypothetical protein
MSATGVIVGLAALLLAAVLPTAAADGDESESDLAKKTQNPVADLISLPFPINSCSSPS